MYIHVYTYVVNAGTHDDVKIIIHNKGNQKTSLSVLKVQLNQNVICI